MITLIPTFVGEFCEEPIKIALRFPVVALIFLGFLSRASDFSYFPK
jgi:hypothetical protein